MTMSDRVPCCIVGCRRTFKRTADDGPNTEIMCGKHYRMGSKWLRSLRTKMRRQGRRLGYSPRMVSANVWIWARIKRQATERSMGL